MIRLRRGKETIEVVNPTAYLKSGWTIIKEEKRVKRNSKK